MAVLNVTPDSFSDGGRFLDPGAAIAHAKEMIGEGADIIDIGAESSRPYDNPVAVTAEVKRRGCRQLDQIAVRFHPEVVFQVPVFFGFEIPSRETPLPVLTEAGEALTVVCQILTRQKGRVRFFTGQRVSIPRYFPASPWHPLPGF